MNDRGAVEFPPMRGIDPLHPLIDVGADEVPAGVYLCLEDDGTVYVTRRAARVYRINCRWHDGPPCSGEELDRAAGYLKDWLENVHAPRGVS